MAQNSHLFGGVKLLLLKVIIYLQYNLCPFCNFMVGVFRRYQIFSYNSHFFMIPSVLCSTPVAPATKHMVMLLAHPHTLNVFRVWMMFSGLQPFSRHRHKMLAFKETGNVLYNLLSDGRKGSFFLNWFQLCMYFSGAWHFTKLFKHLKILFFIN